MKINPELLQFLAPYDESIQQLTLDLRQFILDTLPSTNELIWDNYNAVAIAYSQSDQLKDAFCHLSVYSKHVNLGFNRGAELKKPLIPLQGKGSLIRHIKVHNMASLPKEAVRKMLFEAIGLAESLNPKLRQPQIQSMTKVMSISAKKRRPPQ